MHAHTCMLAHDIAHIHGHVHGCSESVVLTCTSIHGHVNKPLDDMMEGEGKKEREGGGGERENIGEREH